MRVLFSTDSETSPYAVRRGVRDTEGYSQQDASLCYRPMAVYTFGGSSNVPSGELINIVLASTYGMGRDLDDIDRSILYLLQQDARNTTTETMADKAGVSASTVRNRIDRLEADGIINGYHPEIDYEAANLPLQLTFVVSAPPKEITAHSEAIKAIQGVVDVREMLTGRRNIHVDVVGTNTSEITRITDAIHDTGVQIESSEMMRQRHVQPFNHFFLQGTDDMATDATGDDDGEE